MRKYLLFCIFIPILSILFLNTFFFNVNIVTLLQIIIWMYLFQWSAYLLYPWFLYLLKDRAIIFLGTQRILFLVAFTYIIWIIPQFNIFFFSSSFVWSVLLFFIFLSIGGYYLALKKHIPVCNETALKEILIQESLFQYTFIFFLVLHSLYPDSSWGEKSMDLSLLSYLIRRDYFPIFDNWSPDVVMKYYYWGYYCYAGFLKMFNLSNTVGYTVIAATLPVLMVTSLYSLFRWATKQRVLGIGGAIFLVASSNWAAFYLKLVKFPKDHFWYTTRVFENGWFAEYPFWSFIFKDLHPHVFTYPLTIALLTFVFLVRDPYIKSIKNVQYVVYLMLAIIWGSLIGFNGWDFLIYSIIIMWFVLLDKEILKKLFEIGLSNINIGIETVDDNIAKINKRKLTEIKHQEEIINYCNKIGIKVSAFYILGFINDTKDNIKRTIEYAIKLNTNVAQFCISCPYPGTGFYNEIKSKGLLLEKDFEKFNSVELVFKHNNLSKKKILKLQQHAFKKYYFRIGYLINFIKWQIKEF